MTIADKLVTIAENEQKVYDAGYEKGHADGVQSEYDRFWDEYQQNGNRTNYQQAFSFYWTDALFNPKYDLITESCNAMFQYSQITDLKDKLESKGLKFDTSQAISLLQMFQGANITHIPEIDARKATNMSYVFASGCKAVTIDKLIVSENTAWGTTIFNNAADLENIVIEGTIGNNIDLHWSPKLSIASMKSIISCLKDYSGTDSEYTRKLTLTDALWAALEADSTAPDGKTWREYVDSLGWNY